MSTPKRAVPRYQTIITGPSKTKQSFAAETDVNRILEKYQKTGLLPAVQNMQARYGDFSEVVDYQSALHRIKEAENAFMALPSRIRERFRNDPQSFMVFLSDEKNTAEAIKLGLASAKAPSLGQNAENDSKPVPPKEDSGG